MIKPKVSKYVRSDTSAPAESEYHAAMEHFKKKKIWLILLFITRTFISFRAGAKLTNYTIERDLIGTCHVPALYQNNFTFSQIVDISKTYGKNGEYSLEKCTYFDYNYSAFSNISYKEALKLRDTLEKPKEIKCIGGEIFLHTHLTVFSEHDIPYCKTMKLAKWLEANSNISILLGAMFFPFLADLYGRRNISLILSILSTICELFLLAVTPIDIFQFISMVENIFYTGTEIVTYVNLFEICNKKIRFFTVLTLCGNSLGILVIGGILNQLELSWNVMQYISAYFALWTIFYCWYFPESPRWLINKSEYKMAASEIELIIGNQPSAIQLSDEEFETNVSLTTVKEMFRYLKKKELKNVLILGVTYMIFSYVEIWTEYRRNDVKYPLKSSLVARTLNLQSSINTIIIYAVFGKKYGLFFGFVIQLLVSFSTMCLQDAQNFTSYGETFLYMNSVMAKIFVLVYLPDLMPTFLRCTGLGIAVTLGAFIRLVVAIIYNNTAPATHTPTYVAFIVLSLFGLLVFKLKDTTHKSLPNTRLTKV